VKPYSEQLRDLLHWLVDHAEAHPGDREVAHQLVDQAHPEDATPDPVNDAPDSPAGGGPGPEPGGEGA
jgi:hypothetical protein